MPTRGHPTAPKFDPEQPRELRRYFEELEHLFTTCNITTFDEQKRQTTQYLDVQTAELWELLPEYNSQDPNTYELWKRAIIALYPGAKQECKWSIADMDKLVGERSRIRIYSIEDLGAYHRAFLLITTFL